MKKVTGIFIVMLTLFGSFLFIPLYSVISFTETKTTNNPQMYYIVVDQDEIFQIRFTHSIHLTDVLETYKVVDNDKFQLISMEYEDVAVGMPAYAEEGQSLIYEDGKYTLSYSEVFLDNFVLYVGDINTDLFFYYKGKAIDLKKHLQRGNSYLLEIKKFSLYDRMKGVQM